MTRPQPAASMPGSAALVVWKAELRQTAIIASHLHQSYITYCLGRSQKPLLRVKLHTSLYMDCMHAGKQLIWHVAPDS